MTSCVECKRQVDETNNLCKEHPEAKVERRWIGKLAIADDTGSGEAMIYHEALMTQAPHGVMIYHEKLRFPESGHLLRASVLTP